MMSKSRPLYDVCPGRIGTVELGQVAAAAERLPVLHNVGRYNCDPFDQERKRDWAKEMEFGVRTL